MSFSRRLEALFQTVFGNDTAELRNAFSEFTRKMRESNKEHFLSLISVELLDSFDNGELVDVDPVQELNRVFERVKKRLYRDRKNSTKLKSLTTSVELTDKRAENAIEALQMAEIMRSLNDDQLLIVKLTVEGHSAEDIARHFSVSKSEIYRMIKGVKNAIAGKRQN